MVNKILNFDPEGLMKLHFFTDGLEYPIVIAVYSEKEEELLSYMEEMFPTFGFTTMDIIEWCNGVMRINWNMWCWMFRSLVRMVKNSG